MLDRSKLIFKDYTCYSLPVPQHEFPKYSWKLLANFKSRSLLKIQEPLHYFLTSSIA